MILAHPVLATPVVLASGVTMVAAYEGSNLLVGFLGVAMLGAVQSARAQANAYKAWKRDWDSLAPEVPRERKRISAWTWIGLVIAIVVGLEWLGGADGRVMAWGAGFTLCGIWLAALLWAAIRWLWQRQRRPAGSSVVTVVAKPVMAIPSLEDAYRSLPSYCHALLRGQP
jgi:hypothetical protein